MKSRLTTLCSFQTQNWRPGAVVADDGAKGREISQIILSIENLRSDMRDQYSDIQRDIKDLLKQQGIFVRRDECSAEKGELGSSLGELKRKFYIATGVVATLNWLLMLGLGLLGIFR
ncbi:MAG: hypothetical protein ACYC3G_00795 [Minisyncoccota bacterium]